MAGISPNEGEEFRLRAVLESRTFELMLITNATIAETTTYGDLTEPSGGGYARQDLAPGTWTYSPGQAENAQKTYQATGAAYSANPTGYAIVSKAADPLGQKIVALELDAGGEVSMPDGAIYRITPTILAD